MFNIFGHFSRPNWPLNGSIFVIISHFNEIECTESPRIFHGLLLSSARTAFLQFTLLSADANETSRQMDVINIKTQSFYFKFSVFACFILMFQTLSTFVGEPKSAVSFPFNECNENLLTENINAFGH